MNVLTKIFKGFEEIYKVFDIYFHDYQPIEIIDSIFIGSYSAANNKNELLKLNITHIISLSSIFRLTYPNFFYMTISIPDNANSNIKQYFEITNKYIDQVLKNKGKILVHCHKGASRSASIILAYLIFKGYSYEEAFNLCKLKRDIVKPNNGFIKQLKEYSNLKNNLVLSENINYNKIEICYN